MPVLSFTTTESEAGHRLDTVVATRQPTLSRSFVSRLIHAGHITVNGLTKKPGYLTKVGDVVRSEIPSLQPITCQPEPISLSILYEDGDVIVLNKPPGLVVHPAPGHQSQTLVNALLYHCRDLEGIGGKQRPGIVHRLDKNTSGTLVVAKNEMAHEDLSQQFKKRQVRKQYLSLVYGEMKASAGVINLPIGRHPTNRKKMSTKSCRSRPAETQWKIKEAFSGVTLLEIHLKTGRTHQVRVHCAAIGHPVVGDATYGGKKRWKDLVPGPMQNIFKAIRRQMLHAWELTFMHPRTKKWMSFKSPVPEDMASVLESLRTLL
ncbi:MAG: RluA family pseudouridine synthase [Deltaproteobacteria bacterium]|nr:RluA family pseudouridine synthase [Deltaproteobacteria bacterium]MBW2019308.1 RluA family pseudouridine synthase [Deltaproteobacteria bacterium]MBW2074356.1 RluA family pseudouridine synthase [Deltaproteobacteria bacterium]